MNLGRAISEGDNVVVAERLAGLCRLLPGGSWMARHMDRPKKLGRYHGSGFSIDGGTLA